MLCTDSLRCDGSDGGFPATDFSSNLTPCLGEEGRHFTDDLRLAPYSLIVRGLIVSSQNKNKSSPVEVPKHVRKHEYLKASS